MKNNCLIVFGQRVKDLRLLAHMSQEELSFRSGLNRNYLSDVENGKRNLSLISIDAIARGLNVTIDTLFIE